MTTLAKTTARSAWGNVVLCAMLALLAMALLAWHGDDFTWPAADASRRTWAALVLLAWTAFTAWTGWHRRNMHMAHIELDAAQGDSVLIVFASQTGTAEQLARQTAQSLRQAGMNVGVRELCELDAEALMQIERALFVVSTTGEGDAPDSAAAFVTRLMRAPLPLAGLRYGLLALGDRDYDEFCGFGRELQRWLQRGGAQALFDAVEVDNGDPAALRHWQHHLAVFSGSAELPDWQRPDYERWKLMDRQLLNAGSLGDPCFHLALKPMDGHAQWQAGDLVEIGPRHAAVDVEQWLLAQQQDGDALVEHEGQRASLREWLAASHFPAPGDAVGRSPAAIVATLQTLPHREYSIASLPSDDGLHLLVRQMHRDDGRLGIGSGWLTVHAGIGGDIALRIRANPGFHAPKDDRPLILIGNGTGLAGLRALLKSRVERGHGRNWLLFGERQAAHDFYHREEIERWQTLGLLERLDLAWSRDGAQRAYVQDRLRDAGDMLRQWVDDGAAIYVCGSLAGMAPGVDAVLREALGDVLVESLREQGRYRRDVY
ncbi:MAG TPA: sulfite reductase flavoprotein subunit alpha [Dyella sp.]|uniref:sulfite reductase subunit alpha n=1 Tax=Dyella sp. TaxID=1869338 RepID=UPI002D7730E8|nr:sulfite reductase flavoprotein subunit alpha [Dyella sp.]HET6553191.1 sulfite reductase flavoprotein subunit alpha [Dyella sp.]